MEKYLIPNLQNACLVLKWLGEHPKGATIPEIAKALDIPRTTALRIVRTLAVENFLRQEGSNYLLGARLISLGLSARSGVGLRDTVIPHLQRLAKESGETSHVAIPCDGRTLILEVCDSPHPLRAASRAGTLADLHCSSTGKIFLAWLLEDQIEDIFGKTGFSRRTEYTITTVADMRKELAKIREQGFSVDDEEFHAGVRCLAAPIFDASHQVVAALGITASTARFTRAKIGKIAGIVGGIAADISKDLGNHRI